MSDPYDQFAKDTRYRGTPKKKICTGCTKDLRYTWFYPIKRKSGNGYYLNPQCRVCVVDQKRRSKLRRGMTGYIVDYVHIAEPRNDLYIVYGYAESFKEMARITGISFATLVRIFDKNRVKCTTENYEKIKAAVSKIGGDHEALRIIGRERSERNLRRRSIRKAYEGSEDFRQCINCEKQKFITEFPPDQKLTRGGKTRLVKLFSCEKCETKRQRRIKKSDPNRILVPCTDRLRKFAKEIKAEVPSQQRKSSGLYASVLDPIITGKTRKVQAKTAHALIENYRFVLTKRKECAKV